MPFAFLIDDKENNIDEPKLNYLVFLESDFSATISDGITSIIELDQNGYYLGYHSILDNENKKILDAELSKKVLPLRFAKILYNYVKGTKLGVFY